MIDPVTEYQTDHDLLLRLDERTIAMVKAIEALTTSLDKKNDDHEARIRTLETKVTNTIAEREASDRFTKIAGTILILSVGIIEFVIQRIWR